MSLLKKELFKCRIKLLFCYIKAAILAEFFFLWVFSPVFAISFVAKGKLPVLEWILGFQFLIMFYFNMNLVSDDNVSKKWFDKLDAKTNELRCDIDELHYLIEEEKI